MKRYAPQSELRGADAWNRKFRRLQIQSGARVVPLISWHRTPILLAVRPTALPSFEWRS
jgi:hypothetical protein